MGVYKMTLIPAEGKEEGWLNILISLIGFIRGRNVAGIGWLGWKRRWGWSAIGRESCEKGETLTQLCYSKAMRADLQHTHTGRSHLSLSGEGQLKLQGNEAECGDEREGGKEQGSESERDKVCVCASLLRRACRQTSASLSIAIHRMSSNIIC